MLSTDVKLPKSKLARWPARCVRCGARPSTKFRVGTNAIGWWTVFFQFGARFHADAPACEPCAKQMRRQRITRFVIMCAVITLGVFIAGRVLPDYRGYRFLLGALIAIATLIPWILWCVLFPPAVDLTAFTDSVTYEFADADYAMAFAELNDAEVSD